MRAFVSFLLAVVMLLAAPPSQAACEDGSCLELKPGNNLVSFRVLPEDAALKTVFGPVASSIMMVRGEGVIAYRLSDGTHAGSLVTLERNRGYWVTLDAADSVVVMLSGDVTDPDIRYNLHDGSNLVSFPCATSVSVSDALKEGSSEAIENIIGEGKIAQKIGDKLLGSLTSLEPGKGYWVKVKGDVPDFHFVCPSSDAKEDYTYGCKDPIATNFNPSVTVDDGSCTYAVSDAWGFQPSDDEAFYIFHDVRVGNAALKEDEFIGAFVGETCVGFGHPIGGFTTVRALGVNPGVEIVFKSMLQGGPGANLDTLPQEVIKDSAAVLGGCGIVSATNYFADAQMGIGNCLVIDGCDTAPEGTACDDGNECTTDDACDATGLCRGGFVGCPDDSPCFATECLFTGECALWWTDGPCDDGDACTLADACFEGSCTGADMNCPQGEICVDGSCEATEAEPSPESPEEDVVTPEDTIEEVTEPEELPATPDTGTDSLQGSDTSTDAGSPDTGAEPPPKEPDLGQPPTVDETSPVQPASGCSCEAGDSGGSASLFGLLLLGFLMSRRRRAKLRG